MGAPCPSNVTNWTDPTITANTTNIRGVHLTQLRTAVNNELIRRSLAAVSFTDTITSGSTSIKKAHIDELRAAIYQAAIAPACTTDTVTPPSWTDPTITANITNIRKVHIDEMRAVTNNMEDECICNCNYCACDCNCTCHCCTCNCDHYHSW